MNLEKEKNEFMLGKHIPVPEKRQISIPVDFAEEILSDLISQGFSGNELLQKFKETRRKIRPAVESLLEEAQAAVNGESPYFTYKDVFGTEGVDKK